MLNCDQPSVVQVDVTEEQVENVRQEILSRSAVDRLSADEIVRETHVGGSLTDSCYSAIAVPASSSERDHLRRRTFTRLYRCGYTLTSGLKFGCDFLAYAGESVTTS